MSITGAELSGKAKPIKMRLYTRTRDYITLYVLLNVFNLWVHELS